MKLAGGAAAEAVPPSDALDVELVGPDAPDDATEDPPGESGELEGLPLLGPGVV